MIKYYCDICEKELKTSEEQFVYIYLNELHVKKFFKNMWELF